MKNFLSIVAISALLSTGAMSADFIQGGYYGGAGVGVEDFSEYSSINAGYTLVINGGKPIIKLGPGTLGAEGEFTYTIIPMTYGWNDQYDLNILTLGAYATYTFDFSDKFYARGKLGPVNRTTTWDNGYSDDSTFNVAVGIGAGYKINNTLRVFSDLIVLDSSDLKQLNVGVQLTF